MMVPSHSFKEDHQVIQCDNLGSLTTVRVSVSYLVGALSPVNHRGLHQG